MQNHGQRRKSETSRHGQRHQAESQCRKLHISGSRLTNRSHLAALPFANADMPPETRLTTPNLSENRKSD